MKKNSNYTFIDLFSGAGGLLRGFLDAEFNPIFSLEMWEPAIQTHNKNYSSVPLIAEDIRKVNNACLSKYTGKVDVIVGGPPCQGFSTIGKRIVKDPRNELVFEFIRFIDIIKPKFFLMENVRGLLSSNGGKTKEAIKAEFELIGYHNVKYKVLCAADFGVPQIRYRVFFIGVRNDIESDIDFPQQTTEKQNYATVGSAINDLVGLENLIPNHVPMNHNAIVKERMKYIPEGGGIPLEGLPEDVSRGSRSDYKNNRVKNFSHIYKRLDRKKPATTMVPGHNAFPLHPIENRSLTVREAARIQTFPDDVIFMGNRQNQCIQVGNAVPIKLAFELAMNFKKYLNELEE
ncbi:DNA cytosine methyltransferase [Sedimentibacter sp.]|uniref:DNA cytosine methyltransferase n=1 Tax=Sedimentibacter sp. TaxID=1960295 RepID=UPI0028A20DD2|nr:DNA cytosine methyltransferase [Sedimentibacter sp.]